MAFIIIPLALRLIPFAAKLAIHLFHPLSGVKLKCIVAIFVSVMMESIMSFSIVITQYGFEKGWFMMCVFTLIKALPVGLAIGFIMTFIVQPYMQKLTIIGNKDKC